MKRLGVGLYGSNGHQIQALLDGHPGAEAVAWAAMTADAVPAAWQHHPTIRRYDVAGAPPDDFDRVTRLIRDGTPLPNSLEGDLHPTRVVLRAQGAARRSPNSSSEAGLHP